MEARGKGGGIVIVEECTIGDCRLILGDARLILPTLENGSVDCVVTDPVWPNCTSMIPGQDDPYGLLRTVARHFPRLAKRAVLHLGCDSDPRILHEIPTSMPFMRACWLRYARPSYKGRILVGSEVAYVFGTHPSTKTYTVAPGEMCHTRNDKRIMRHTADGEKDIDYSGRHPCPRQTDMVAWIVKWFGGESVLDPFSGSMTTAVACANQRKSCIAIEIDPGYYAIGVDRVREAMGCNSMFPPEPVKPFDMFAGIKDEPVASKPKAKRKAAKSK